MATLIPPIDGANLALDRGNLGPGRQAGRTSEHEAPLPGHLSTNRIQCSSVHDKTPSSCTTKSLFWSTRVISPEINSKAAVSEMAAVWWFGLHTPGPSAADRMSHGIDLDMVSRSDAKLDRSNNSPRTHDCGQGDTFGTELGCTLPSLTTNACRQPDWLPLTAPWNKADAPTKYNRWVDCWLQLQHLQHLA
ncbi:hypothetical protein GGP41_009903 [Bipolaris sorokiniana]|uniref:Uncharacterized protein n=1 Tax=Cochliobolus sativus TaxID=45130 RepID=A0A8H6DUW9_COCSA|nr:hypothetical protein GGP41_009903 [Bipolaris sorokiniana]